jgi:hypothetical protein
MTVVQTGSPRVLLFSQRNIFSKALFRAALYEFEDIISQIDTVDILAPKIDLLTPRQKIARRLAYHAPAVLNPGVGQTTIQTHYDVFLAICGAPTDLLMLNAVANWRAACKTSVCLVDELWVNQMHSHRNFLRILENFDVIMLYYSQSVSALSKRIGRKCVFLPPGVDSIVFCPYPKRPKRSVDVYSIGRRSDITHRRLLRMVAEDGLFYLHDSVGGDQAIKLDEHRSLFANIGKRSRYFVVNPGLIDRPDIRGSQIEVGNRYFEGAACGTIMLGERPNNSAFDALFDWPDALIALPYGSNDISSIIHNLDAQPERQDSIRRSNVVHSLRRHDWVYRWEAILKVIGLEPMPQLAKRKERLSTIAEAVERHDEGT